MYRIVLTLSLFFLCGCMDYDTKNTEAIDINLSEIDSAITKVILNPHFKAFDNTEYGYIIKFLESYLSGNVNSKTFADNYWRSELNECVEIPGLHFIEYFQLVQQSCDLFLNGISAIDDNLYEIHLTVMYPKECFPVVSFYLNYLDDKDGGSFVDPLCINLRSYREQQISSKNQISVMYSDSKIPKPEELDSISAFASKMDAFFDKTVAFKALAFHSNKELDNLRGFDYTLRTWSLSTEHSGLADTHNNYLFSVDASFYYPHEIVHFYTADQNCNTIFDEGIATYFGKSRNRHLDELINELKVKIVTENYAIPSDITQWDTTYINEHNGLVYSLGGLLMKKAIEQGGKHKAVRLLNYGKTEEDFYRAIDLEFGLKENTLIDSLNNWIISN